MKTIKVSTSGSAELSCLLLRQTPGGRGVWGDCRFLVNQPVERCDWWVVCHNSGLRRPETTYCDPNHLVYISMETSESSMPEGFLSQFAKLVLCDRSIVHPDITYLNGLTWWVGIQVTHDDGHIFSPKCTLDYDSLSNMRSIDKSKMLSVICSNKLFMDGHKKRVKFLEKLMVHPISAHIDLFGGGINPVDDKWDAIAPYKYHIVLENSVVPDYWTEKLADSFLGFAFPIYYGCPNILDYFSPQSLISINIEDFDQSIAVIEKLIDSDPYTDHFEAILQARNQVIDQYNIFQLISDICNKPAEHLVKCRLHPSIHFSGHFLRSWPRRIARRLIHWARGIRFD